MPRVLYRRVSDILNSSAFFYFVLFLFISESLWIALSAAYPGVFDENVHFSVISLYTHHLNPLFRSHYNYTEPAGALSSDPSILYRYLLSFILRLIKLVVSSQTIQIILLRVINIAIYASAIALFRKLLLKSKATKALVNLAILFFILLPVVPLIASEINYDSMLLLITAWAFLVSSDIDKYIKKHKTIPVFKYLCLILICFIGCLTQTKFLPLATAIILWQLYGVTRLKRSSKKSFMKIFSNWRDTKVIYRFGLIIALVVCIYGAGYTYGVNIVKYHSITPSCSQVLTKQECSTDKNWLRQQQALDHKVPTNKDPFVYLASWSYRMFIELFYTSSGGAGPKANYISVNPLPVLFISAIVLFVFGVLAFLFSLKALFTQYELMPFLIFITLFYVAVLSFHNFTSYLQYGQKFGINGRYILPIAMPIILFTLLGYNELLNKKRGLKYLLTAISLLLFTQGGGALTYIAVSNTYWYWPNKTVDKINRDAQDIVKPLIIDKSPIGPIRS